MLTGSLTSCKTIEEAPAFPTPNQYQVVVDQIFCDDDGSNCTGPVSFCQELIFNDQKQEYVLGESLPLKGCHGNIGVTTDGYKAYRKYMREMETWIKKNVKTKD